MLEYSIIEYSSKSRGCKIYYPVFSDQDESCVKRMNDFYLRTAEAMDSYAAELSVSVNERIAYICKSSVDMCEETAEVKLFLSLRRTGHKTLRKYLIHTWKNGNVISKKITEK